MKITQTPLQPPTIPASELRTGDTFRFSTTSEHTMDLFLRRVSADEVRVVRFQENNLFPLVTLVNCPPDAKVTLVRIDRLDFTALTEVPLGRHIATKEPA